jgi:asparagine synthase (glutamine-hydrolysing)
VEQAVGEGFSPLDALDLFYAYDRVRRWAGTNHRKMSPICDPFAPFCTRPYVEAAFSLPARYRYSEPVHYQLIGRLAPELQAIPFNKGSWRSQHPIMNLASWLIDRSAGQACAAIRSRSTRRQGAKRVPLPQPSGQAVWLEARRSWLRQICLDQPYSPLWNFVDRSMFEHITAPGTHPAERTSRTEGLYAVATLFAYAQRID